MTDLNGHLVFVVQSVHTGIHFQCPQHSMRPIARVVNEQPALQKIYLSRFIYEMSCLLAHIDATKDNVLGMGIGWGSGLCKPP